MNRKLLVLFTAIGIAAAAAPAAFHAPVRIAYNPSPSAPLGWYRVQSVASPAVGDYVLATLPTDAAALAARRGYLPADLAVLKQVAARAGQQVCIRGDAVLIDGKTAGRVLRGDRQQRPLPAWRQCRVLANGELFLLNATNPASFDSRYFGPVLVSAVRGRAVPLWTWSAP